MENILYIKDYYYTYFELKMKQYKEQSQHFQKGWKTINIIRLQRIRESEAKIDHKTSDRKERNHYG